MVRAGAMLGGRYVLQELIAGGGMGDVWRGEDTVLGRTVAVKVLLPAFSDDPDFAARFHAEARAMAALSHPGIVDVYDFGHEDSTAYLVMQYVRGDSLRTVLDRLGQFDPEDAMQLVAEIADALHAAHTTGIVHRDVKPGNLMIRVDGRLVLTDFGIARIAAGDGITEAGTILGTASYLAPEQVTGGIVTPAADVYALGVVAYECLAGRRPFGAATPVATAMQRLDADPAPLPAEIPEPIRRVVERALARDPAARWPSAAALAEAARAARAAAARAVAAQQAESLALDSARAGFSRFRRPVDDRSARSLRSLDSGSSAAGRAKRTWSTRAALAAGVAALLVAAAGIVAFQMITADGSAGQGTDTKTEPGSAAAVGTGPSGATGTSAGSRTGRARRPPPPPADKAPVGPTPSTIGGGDAEPPAATPPPTTPPVKPQPREVPNVIGMDEQSARDALAKAGFVPEVKYQPTTDRCTVLLQDPKPGVLAPHGSVVTIIVGDALGPCLL
ncbi:MAG TPA: serine/threonine protein kinase [Pilimelia sp.]|nr:serine/threonine protein kinase [Pilimelia sp.]